MSPGGITVNRWVDWPQDIILTGTNKTRPSYDVLTITQWVSEFLRCIPDEGCDSTKASMLHYLANLMEDASDHSWDSAIACHVSVLTNIMADRISWHETDKLKRIQRAHAERYTMASRTFAFLSQEN